MIFLLTLCGNPVLFLTSYRIVCCSHRYQPQLLSASLSPSLMLWFLFSPMDSPIRHLGVQTWTEVVHPNLASSTLKNPDPQLEQQQVKVAQTSRDTRPDSPSWHIIQLNFFQKQPQHKSEATTSLPVARPERDLTPTKGKAEGGTGIPVLSFGTP